MPNPAPRRSNRPLNPRTHLNDYVFILPSTKVAFLAHWCNLVQTTATIQTVIPKEPSSFQEASCDPGWVQAMEKELKSLESNHTWEETYLLQMGVQD